MGSLRGRVPISATQIVAAMVVSLGVGLGLTIALFVSVAT